MKTGQALLAIFAALLASPASAASLIRGTALVERNCSHCHATGPMDASTNPQAPPLRTLHRYTTMRTLSEALHRGLLVSHYGMPQLKFTTDQLDDILLYIERLQSSDTELKRPVVERRPRGWATILASSRRTPTAFKDALVCLPTSPHAASAEVEGILQNPPAPVFLAH